VACSCSVQKNRFVVFVADEEVLLDQSLNFSFNKLRRWLEHVQCLQNFGHEVGHLEALPRLHDSNDRRFNSVSSVLRNLLLFVNLFKDGDGQSQPYVV